MRRFRLTQTDLLPGCREIAVEGELDLSVSAQLDSAIYEFRGALVRINFARCQFIDSSVISTLVRADRRMKGEARHILVIAPSGQVLRLLAVTGLIAAAS